MISDGKKTCGWDPIKNTTTVKEEKGVFVYLIGFGVNEDEEAELRKIAAAGGGTYYSAGTPVEFGEAIETVKKEVIVAPLQIEQDVQQYKVEYGKLQVRAPQWFEFYEWRVTKAGEDERIQSGRKNPPAEIPLDPGLYEFHCVQQQVSLKQEEIIIPSVKVEKGQTTLIDILDQDILVKAAENVYVFSFEIYKKDSTGSQFTLYLVSREPITNFFPMYLPQGEYKIKVFPLAGKSQMLADVFTVASGKVTEVMLDTAVTFGFDEPSLKKLTEWQLIDSKTNNKISFYPGYHVDKTIYLNPRTYELWVLRKQENKPLLIIKSVTIKPNKNNKVEVNLGF